MYFCYLDNHNERNFLVDSEMSDAEFNGLSSEDPKLEQALISYFVSGGFRAFVLVGNEVAPDFRQIVGDLQ